MKITAYFSHPIRGEKGARATPADMSLNNDVAALASHCLRNALPVLDLYVPAIHDEYVLEAFHRGSHNEHEILEIDKAILAKRDILIVFSYNDVISTGMTIEIKEAMRLGIPVFTFSKLVDIPCLAENILHWYHNEHLSKES